MGFSADLLEGKTRRVIIGAFIAVFAIWFGVVAVLLVQTWQAHPNDTVLSQVQTKTISVDFSVTSPINGDSVKKVADGYEVNEGTSALDILTQAGFKVATATGADGVSYVKTIDGLSNGDRAAGTAWVLQVNGVVRTEDPSTVILNDGDGVSWTFQVR